MTSSINPNNIDGTYPIAGQDNDSQGFRDNFTNIKNNLTFAKSELEDLQSKVLVTSQLAGGSAVATQNNLNNTPLIGAQLKKTTLTVFEQTNTTGTIDISWADGSYQVINATTGSVNLTFSGWPSSGSLLACVVLEITISSTAHTLTLPSEVSVGNARIQGASVSNVITFDAADTYQFEFSSWDSGDTITIRDLTRNYESVTTGVTGVFTTLTANTGTISGNLTSSSNLITAGSIINSGYQYANSNASFGNIVSGNTFAVSNSVNRVILEPTTTFDSLFITLPANVNAKTISISSTATITNVSVSGSTGTSVAPSGNITLTAGQKVEYIYLSSKEAWYRS